MTVASSMQNKDAVSDYEKLGAKKEVVVKRSQLPLHCPMDESAIWCAHPRVFLAIEGSKDQQIRCPYCGTLYRLQE